MIQAELVKGNLLYHPVHGLCRIDQVIQESTAGKKNTSYALVPKISQKMKTRFIIPNTDIKVSGFHSLVSVKEADEILAYLKAGKSDAIPAGVAIETVAAFAQPNQTWSLAKTILSFPADKVQGRDQRKRQVLEQSIKGLIGELALVFAITLKEAADKILKSLGNPAKINPVVLTAVTRAGSD